MNESEDDSVFDENLIDEYERSFIDDDDDDTFEMNEVSPYQVDHFEGNIDLNEDNEWFIHINNNRDYFDEFDLDIYEGYGWGNESE